ncbi:MAG: ROK family transcriptional regulator [Chloroflexota bacterium]|nr:ROK family transcriptional regulator [Chloroflexota bacterium]
MSDPTIAVLEALARRAPVSRAELAGSTGLSAATVGRTVGRLRRDGVVREYALQASGVGRPPRVVELDDRAAFVIGIDAGGRTLRASIADLAGNLRRRVARPVRDPGARDGLVDDVAALVAELSADVRPGSVQAVVAGVSGIVDHDEGRVLLSPDLPGLDGLALARALRDRLDLPTGIDNDDLLAAIGEATSGAAIGCRDVVFLSLGYGLGAGLIVAGRPVRGASNAAGAIAFLSPGRLEDRASGRAIPGRYRILAGRKDDGASIYDARSVFELAARGDELAARVVADVTADLGDLVVDVAALLDPEVIVVGGGLAEAGAALFAPLSERLAYALPYPPRLVPSALEDAAVLHGAVSVALALARRRLAGHSQPSEPETRHPELALL